MNRTITLSAALLLGMVAQATAPAKGTHIKQAILVARSGATVASATPDASGRCVFRNVPEGEYKIVLTSSEGRSVTIGDLDGDGVPDLIVQGSGGGSGKASMSDLSFTKSSSTTPKQTQGATFGEKVNAGMAAAGSSVSQGASVVSPRDPASGLATGKRMHKPLACVVGWDGTVKGFASEAAARGATSSTAPATGGVGVKVHCPTPSTVEILSWSWGVSQTGTMTPGSGSKG